MRLRQIVPGLLLALAPSLAWKNNVPPTLARTPGNEPPLPERMSLTKAVPVAVPSLFHNS